MPMPHPSGDWALGGGLFWKFWALQCASLFCGLVSLLGLAGWTEALRDFLFGKEAPEEATALSFGMSLVFFSLWVWGLGVNDLLYPGGVALFLAPQVSKGFKVLARPWFKGWSSWQKGIFLFSLVPWFFEYFSPPILWDAVLDHYRFAREITRLHQIPFHWVNHTGDIPKGAELIWAGFWALGGESLARLSGSLVLIGTLLLGWAFARRLRLPEWPIWIILTTCPFWLAMMGWGYDEGLLALEEALAVMAILLAFRADFSPAALGVGLFFLGAALGVKYTALFAWVGSLALVSFLILQKKSWPRFHWIGFLFLLLPALPWLLRNDLANGNPFYPMATAWFGGPVGYGPGQESALWADTGRAAGFSPLGALRTLALDFGTARNQVGAPLTPLLLMSLPLGWRLRSFGETRGWLIFACFFLGAWLVFATSLRHAAGAVLALSLLGGAVWALALKDSRPWVKWVFGLGVLAALWTGWMAQWNCTSPYGCALGLQNPLERLKDNYDMDFDTFSAYEAAEKNTSVQDRVLAFAVFQTYPLERTAYVDFFWKRPIFLAWASQCRDAGELAERLKRSGVTCFLYQRMESAYMSRKEKDFALSGMPVSEYIRFWNRYTQPMAQFENSSLYRILDRPLEKPRPLTDLPGLEEAWLAPLLAAERKGDGARAYQEALELTRHYPQAAIGWERRAFEAGAFKRWEEAFACGQKAQGLGMVTLDLCGTMERSAVGLGRPQDADLWRQKEAARVLWLEGLKKEALSFEAP